MTVVHLRFGHFVRVDAAEALTLRVHHHHDPIRLGRLLVEDRLQNLDDELHRGVVVVQQQDLEELRLLGLLSVRSRTSPVVRRSVSAMPIDFSRFARVAAGLTP